MTMALLAMAGASARPNRRPIVDSQNSLENVYVGLISEDAEAKTR